MLIPILIGLALGAFSVWLDHSFEREIPKELFDITAKGAPPSFYTFDFTDRTNRQGEARLLTVGTFSQTHGSYTAYDRLPEDLIHAFVAIEDKRFYQHRGVDWYRTLAAGVTYVFGFSDSFGASTITQQTVKNVTGNSEVTLKRKLQEILYALDLERLYTKEEILELYLNVISFSDGCIGVGEAADYYFSKTPQELTVAEAATIAAITNHPSYYNPIRHPENNLRRRDLILLQMKEQGYLSEEEYGLAVKEPLRLNHTDRQPREEIRSWYTDMVIEDVINDLCRTYGWSRSVASLRVHSGSLRIDIPMDLEIQEAVEDYYRNVVRTPVSAEGEQAQSALIVIDSKTGDILGVAGAIGEKRANRIQNYATQTLRSPGSSIKPITVYAPALEKGMIHWASVYDDVPVRFTETGKNPWPSNANGVYRGLTNISHAVAHSTNTVAVRVLEELGLRESFRVAKEQFHLEHLVDTGKVTDCDVAALALGQLNYGVTLREMTAAYSVFADGGCYHQCRSYYRVLDENGEVLLAVPDTAQVVMSPENAAIMTKLLQGVVDRGTSSSITLTRRTECAGKTGTTQNDHDRWFIGYTPEMICGVWCGYEYPKPLSGSNLCTEIWNEVMGEIVSLKGGRREFTVPRGLIRLSYCRDSGMLMDDVCGFDPRGDRSEVGWFTADNCPKGRCDRHVLCHCDRDGGGISHGFCPFTKPVALIRAERSFPFRVLVNDAQYVYRGDPMTMPPNPNGKQAYFEDTVKGSVGGSHTESPFNRSCDRHTAETGTEEETPPREEFPMTLPIYPDTRFPEEGESNEDPRHKPPVPRIW